VVMVCGKSCLIGMFVHSKLVVTRHALTFYCCLDRGKMGGGGVHTSPEEFSEVVLSLHCAWCIVFLSQASDQPQTSRSEVPPFQTISEPAEDVGLKCLLYEVHSLSAMSTKSLKLTNAHAGGQLRTRGSESSQDLATANSRDSGELLRRLSGGGRSDKLPKVEERKEQGSGRSDKLPKVEERKEQGIDEVDPEEDHRMAPVHIPPPNGYPGAGFPIVQGGSAKATFHQSCTP